MGFEFQLVHPDKEGVWSFMKWCGKMKVVSTDPSRPCNETIKTENARERFAELKKEGWQLTDFLEDWNVLVKKAMKLIAKLKKGE